MAKPTKKIVKPTLRTAPQQSRGQERVNLILGVSENLLLSKGYEALTTNAVAAAAGISIGSLYHFFTDKVAILEALIARYNEAYFEVLTKVHRDKIKIESYVDTLLETLIRFGEGRPGIMIAMSHAITASEKFETMEADFKTRASAMMGAAYRQRNAKLGEKKAALIAWTVMVMAEGFLLALDDSTEAEGRYQEIKKAMKGYLGLYL